jgi:hypothetical protein
VPVAIVGVEAVSIGNRGGVVAQKLAFDFDQPDF